MSLQDVSSALKVHKQIERELELMILRHTFQPGDSLPSERELMATFGVGRTAVREALLSLEHAGVVRLRKGSPAVVTRVSTQQILSGLTVPVRSFMNEAAGIRELQDARKLIECAIARCTASQRNEGDIARIQHALEANAAALHDGPSFERTDIEFHAEIVRTVRNRIFEATQLALGDWLLEQRQTTLTIAGQSAKALSFHIAIFEAIKRGDPDAAERAMSVHMDQTIEMYWQAVTF
ncbi:MAG: FCD domain-containing protein [Rhodoferax sp.]|nr:FCD domain-containing protein [Rhodoferax sp.]